MERKSKSNLLVETSKEQALKKTFNYPFPFANAILIGMIESKWIYSINVQMFSVEEIEIFFIHVITMLSFMSGIKQL